MAQIPEKVMHPLQPLHHPVENLDFPIISFVMVVYQMFFSILSEFSVQPKIKKYFQRHPLQKRLADQSQFSELSTTVNEDIRHIRTTNFRKQIQCQIRIRIEPQHAELFLI